MIEIAVGAESLARVRFVTDPVWEAVSSVAALKRPASRAVHGRLHELRSQVPPDTMRLLDDVCGDPSWAPDFMTPEPVADGVLSPIEALEQIRVADLELVEGGRQMVLAAHPDSVVAGMSAPEFRDAVTDALGEYWPIVLEPLWGRLEAIAKGDIAHRSLTMSADGLAPVLSDLNERISFDGNMIRVPCWPEVSIDPTEGLWLVPSVFRWPGILIQFSTRVPVINYAARGAGLVWGEDRAPADGLAKLLGQTRARVLDEADLPASTTHLATSLGLAKGTVSEHLSTLSDAGLLRSWRDGRSVLYARTPLGDELLATAAGDIRA